MEESVGRRQGGGTTAHDGMGMGMGIPGGMPMGIPASGGPPGPPGSARPAARDLVGRHNFQPLAPGGRLELRADPDEELLPVGGRALFLDDDDEKEAAVDQLVPESMTSGAAAWRCGGRVRPCD